MCGRFTLVTDAKALIAEFAVEATLFTPTARYNIAPSLEIPVVRNRDNVRLLTQMQWGLRPFWAKEIKAAHRPINARSESLMEKPTFRKAYQKQRCLIPASGFYEWDAHSTPKQPYYFHLKDKPLFAFAGLWDRWTSDEGQVIESCALITRAATERVSAIHDRMPVVLDPSAYTAWLTCEDRDFFKETVTGFDFYPVSRDLNSARADGPELIRPI